MPSASGGYAALTIAMPGRVEDQRPANYRAYLSRCYGIPQCSPSVLESHRTMTLERAYGCL